MSELISLPESAVHQNGSNAKASDSVKSNQYGWEILQSSLILVANILIGMVLGVSLAFAYRDGIKLDMTSFHIVLSVIGFQLLMAEGILYLTKVHSNMTLTHKKRAHWILQIPGSILAIVGTIPMYQDKDTHWVTPHGRYGLVALVFTVVSLLNGLSSLYAFELRKFIPGYISKLSHISFGIIAFVTSSISLCYSYDYYFFRQWATDTVANVTIVFTGIFTLIAIINPVITFYIRSKTAIRN